MGITMIIIIKYLLSTPIFYILFLAPYSLDHDGARLCLPFRRDFMQSQNYLEDRHILTANFTSSLRNPPTAWPQFTAATFRYSALFAVNHFRDY